MAYTSSPNRTDSDPSVMFKICVNCDKAIADGRGLKDTWSTIHPAPSCKLVHEFHIGTNGLLEWGHDGSE